ncbi:hypothetical protein AKJ16_DCAP14684 [Drosera capensis]
MISSDDYGSFGLEFDLPVSGNRGQTLTSPMPDRGFRRSRGFDDDDRINHRGVETLMSSCGSTIGGNRAFVISVYLASKRKKKLDQIGAALPFLAMPDMSLDVNEAAKFGNSSFLFYYGL